VPALEAIISPRMTLSNDKDMDLRAAAAFALRTIASEAAIAALERHWSELKFTRLDLLDHRSNNAVSRFGTRILRAIFPADDDDAEDVDDL
jgi:hypothetical protein